VGEVVRLFTLRQGDANLVELTLAADSPMARHRVADVVWPADCTLVSIVRDARVITPSPDDTLEDGDELLFVAAPASESELQTLLAPHASGPGR